MLPSRGAGSFFLLDKELKGRKIVREFSKDLLWKQKVKGKQELIQ
jgi:hypothetical protein